MIDVTLLLQFHDRGSLSAFVVGRCAYGRDERVLLEERAQRLAQPARAVPVHDAHAVLVSHQRIVQKLPGAIERLVHFRTNEDQFGGGSRLRN